MPQDQLPGRKACSSVPMRGILMRAALGAALSGFVACATSTVVFAGDNDDTMGTTSMYDKFLKVIGVKGENDDINYNERSPLVIPPTRDLPPPSAGAPPPTPDWPKDPDLTRRVKAKVQEKPGPHPDYADTDNLPLRPDQLDVPGANTSSRTASMPRGPSTGADYPEGTPARRSKSIFSFDFLKKEQYSTFTGEPARASLTDPPPGYMTPSPDQPYGVGPEQRQTKIPTVADRVDPAR
jgi:hypothetical protein